MVGRMRWWNDECAKVAREKNGSEQASRDGWRVAARWFGCCSDEWGLWIAKKIWLVEVEWPPPERIFCVCSVRLVIFQPVECIHASLPLF